MTAHTFDHAGVRLDAHAAQHAQFRWQVPRHFNIAQVCCGRWAARPDAASRIAVRVHQDGAAPLLYSYAELQQQANRLSNALTALGVQRGERVAIVLPQRFEAAVAYMAVWQLGALAMPLSSLFGPEALEFRLHDSEAVLALCDGAGLERLRAARASCVQLRQVIAIDAASENELDYAALLAQHSADFVPVQTLAEDAAVLIYTSGTTGNPKGALIPHRALIGNLSGFVCSQNGFGFTPEAALARSPEWAPAGTGLPCGLEPAASVFWSPADWTWTGGLMDALLPTLYFGRPIVAYAGRFSALTALQILQAHGVTHSFLFPTALKAMMKAYPTPTAQFEVQLQAIMSAGEAVGDAVFVYCQEQLGVTVNEMFGQTEVNYIVGNCSMDIAPMLGASRAGLDRPMPEATSLRPVQTGAGRSGAEGLSPEGANFPRGGPSENCLPRAMGWPAKPGSMGKPYPGHRVAVLDEAGRECAVGEVGDVALHRFDVHGHPDPIFFLGYWKNPDASAAKFSGDWCRTGDLATRDADGYLWYQGRADDMFKVAGYRIGPGEIENCLVKHPAVANAAVVPKPDAARGALVKAYVVLAPDFAAERLARGGAVAQFDAELVAQLQAHVAQRLAPYEYPKEIEFIDALPMTTTGKVQRRVLRLQEQDRAAATKSGLL